MQYLEELNFMKNILSKYRINCLIKKTSEKLISALDKCIEPIFKYLSFKDMSIGEYFNPIMKNKIYKIDDFLGLTYIFFILPNMPDPTLLLVGPYSPKQITLENLLKIEESFGIPKTFHKYCIDYVCSVPYIADENQIFSIIETFVELIYDNYKYEELKISLNNLNFMLNKNKNELLDTTLYDMAMMEKRYDTENQLLNAVSLGQLPKINQILKTFTTIETEKRSTDFIREIKNYYIIMNTLLRKAIEKGGVHPFHIDTISSIYAKKIEQINSHSSAQILLNDMIKEYCNLVNNHSMKKYSKLIKNTIILIESDLAANLTLSTIAKSLNVSSCYLSTLFKKEPNQTLSSFIKQKRMEYATNLLVNTNLQIQTIANHCGISDLQYFSHQYKKYSGKSPKEYRDNINK